jgi:hypothetical protein
MRPSRCQFRKSGASQTSCLRKQASGPHGFVSWIPACAGMTLSHKHWQWMDEMDSRRERARQA